MDWSTLLPVLIPSIVAVGTFIISLILKVSNSKLTGMVKEISELLLSIYDAQKDGTLTDEELKKILDEAEDVIEEAKNLLVK